MAFLFAGRVAPRRETLVFLPLFLGGLAGSKTEQSPSVERELSKAFLRLSGEIQRDSFRLSLPYVFRINGSM